jgi:serine/threonine protein kinase
MRCPVCQTENPPTARVCSHCGGGLTSSAAGSGLAGTGGFPGGPISDDREPARPAAEPLAPGSLPERFENYEILRKADGTLWELGRGAMGITYKAIDADLQVPVALKVINPSVLSNTDAAERFLREARSAAKLRHGNIASVFRLGRVGGMHFYAMEFCEGQTVHQLVERRGPLELKLALEITQQVTNALVVAQDHSVVHRDIKPSNLMITGRVPDEFTVKVIDFGLAKHTSADSAAADLTVASDRHGFVGTAHFASPEQLEDRAVDFRSDIYSLGVTLWFMLTGKPLFEGSLTRVVTQHLVQKAPTEKLAWLPARIAALLDSMLAKDPDQRPASMRELRETLALSIEECSFDQTMAAPSNASPASSAASLRPASSASAVPASSAAAGTRPPPAALLPTMLPPVIPPTLSPLVPSASPARPKPTSAGPVLIIGLILVLLIVAAGGAGYAFNRWGRKLLTHQSTQTDVSPPDVTPALPLSSPPAPPTTVATIDALREAHLAQDAAEKLSQTLHNAEVNAQLIALVQARPNVKPEDLDQYRTSEQAIERNIIDAETAYLLAAKRLGKVDPDTLRAAFDKLEDEVSSAGIGWRTKVAQILRRHVPSVEPFATRVDADFRAQLKGLQKD